MKSFEELTDKELLGLTDEMVQYYVDYACAQAGVPFLPPYPNEPEKSRITPDTVLYQVGELKFADRSIAEQIVSIAKGKMVETDYISGPSYQKKISSRTKTPSISEIDVFSEDAWKSYGTAVVQYESDKKDYESAKKEYDRISSLRNSVSDEIYMKISKVKEAERKKENYRLLFKNYLDLSKGDREIAFAFLEKAYPGIKDWPELVAEFTGNNNCSESVSESSGLS
jgi:hypothetical protein